MIDFKRLIGQFVVSSGWRPGPASGCPTRSETGNWRGIPALPAMRLLGGEDRPVGWLLGYPISEAGTLLIDGACVPGASARVEIGGATGNVHLRIRRPFRGGNAGCPSALLRRPVRVALGASTARISAMIASTPNLIPYDEASRDRVELALAIGIPYTEGMYPLDMTPRYGVERVLPNHYLDLRSWRTVRHWPKRPLADGGIGGGGDRRYCQPW